MGKIRVLLSMDWEGCDLKEINLSSIKGFKKKWENPFTHYLNPAYYTNPKTKHLNITKLISNTLSPEDEIGLHLHAPKHLLREMNIAVKSSPTFSKHGDYNSGDEFGQEVMLHGYDQEELDQMISFSTMVLNRKGFKGIESFRAGGWMCDEKIIGSLSKNKFKYESSATVASLLNGSSWEGDNLQRYISVIWNDITPESRPYIIHQNQHNKILEVPNNLGAIDYWQNNWIEDLVNTSLKNSTKDKNYVCVINSHQETFSKHRIKLERYLSALSEIAEVSFVGNRNL